MGHQRGMLILSGRGCQSKESFFNVVNCLVSCVCESVCECVWECVCVCVCVSVHVLGVCVL